MAPNTFGCMKLERLEPDQSAAIPRPGAWNPVRIGRNEVNGSESSLLEIIDAGLSLTTFNRAEYVI